MKAVINNKEINAEKNGAHVVLEAGPTHYGLESAKQLVTVASESGADSVKFQMVDADRLMADKTVPFSYDYLQRDADGNETFITTEESLYEIIRRRELAREEWLELKAHCDSLGLHMFVTATYCEEIEFIVNDLNIDSVKIASGDVDDLEFIEFVAKKGVNIQLDTGNADMWEIERAVIVAEEAGNNNIIIHHCPSGYPARLESIHLNQIRTLKQLFSTHSIAYSDHSPGWEMDIAAIAMGVDMVEKTITLDRTIMSCEHSFSLEPQDCKDFVNSIRTLETALGLTRRTIPTSVKQKRKVARRSPYALKPLAVGDEIKREDFDFKRPAVGVTREDFEFFVGKKLIREIDEGTPITFDFI